MLQSIAMTIRLDPEANETTALLHITGGFARQRILEIGSGEGRLTWRYAAQASHVTAIDTNTEKIERARQSTPPELAQRVDFHIASLEEFYAAWRPHPHQRRFDQVLLSWSL
jgi:2-polyprenyl-3-methyl-5-hydroxy-6-metoxy-1,4-benzoquinol methylase